MLWGAAKQYRLCRPSSFVDNTTHQPKNPWEYLKANFLNPNMARTIWYQTPARRAATTDGPCTTYAAFFQPTVNTSANILKPSQISFGNLRVHLNNFPGFARRISARSSRTIRQTPLLGRRPAVRRKPLNPGAGHGARVLAGACRRPSVVTESYRCCAPAADPPPDHSRSTEVTVYFACGVKKTPFF